MPPDENWIESLPEALQEAPYFKPTEDGTPRQLDQVIADLSNAAKLQGDLTSTHIRIPSADDPDSLAAARAKAMEKIPGITALPGEDDEEGWEKFYNSAGRPEKAAGYKLPEDKDGALKGIDLDVLREQAFKNGLTQRQFDNHVAQLTGERASMTEAQQAQMEEGRAKLKEKWGAAYEERRGLVAEFLKQDATVPAEICEAFANDMLNPETVLWLHSLADSISSEDSQLAGQRGGANEPTPDEAIEQVSEIEARLFKMRKSDPDYQRLVDKRMRLLKKAYPEASSDINQLRA